MQLWFGAPRSRAENSETVTADSILLKILRITVTLEIDSLFWILLSILDTSIESELCLHKMLYLHFTWID